MFAYAHVTTETAPDRGASTVSVCVAPEGGWDLRVERDGELPVVEHYSDWHRVERRCALLTSLAARIRLLSVVLAVVGIAAHASAQEAAGFIPEPRLLERGIALASGLKEDETRAERDGFYADVGNMVTGAGWLSIGPGYRYRVFGDRALVDVSTAISTRAYKTAKARVEFPGLAHGAVAVGSEALWQDLTQVNYFGAGATSVQTARSDYRLRTLNLVGYGTVHTRVAAFTVRAGWLARPQLASSTGPMDRDLPDAHVQFNDEPGVVGRQPQFLHADLALTRDTRDHPGHPTRGTLGRIAATGFWARETSGPMFTRYEAEAARFLPLLGGRSVLILHGWGIFTKTTQGRAVPLYLLPSLGGSNTLRGFADYRFHDRDAVVLNVESRWALLAHVDAAVFVDAGNVAARVHDVNLDRTSYGVGARAHTGASTIARFDVARGAEGWRLWFRLNDPMRLMRLARRTAPIPFVP